MKNQLVGPVLSLIWVFAIGTAFNVTTVSICFAQQSGEGGGETGGDFDPPLNEPTNEDNDTADGNDTSPNGARPGRFARFRNFFSRNRAQDVPVPDAEDGSSDNVNYGQLPADPSHQPDANNPIYSGLPSDPGAEAWNPTSFEDVPEALQDVENLKSNLDVQVQDLLRAAEVSEERFGNAALARRAEQNRALWYKAERRAEAEKLSRQRRYGGGFTPEERRDMRDANNQRVQQIPYSLRSGWNGN